MARLYISNIDEFMCLNGMSLVTAKRRERVHAYLRAEDKARCLLSGLLLRRVCGVTDDSRLTYGKNGKPYLKNSDMYFNISHSGDYVIIVTADGEVGADIEKTKPYSDAVATRCFTPREYEWMRLEGNNEAFYRLWTAKESVMKATGMGFSLSPETFCVLPMDSSARSIAGKRWFLEWTAYDGHIICHAVEKKAEKTEIITMTSSELL